MKRMVKVLMVSIIALFVILAVIVISYFVIENNGKEKIVSDEIPVGQQYTPKIENIKTDEKTGIKYIDNEIMIMFEGHVSEEQQKEIIEEIAGKLVGNIGSTVKQVEVPSRSLDGLKKLVKELESKDEVFGAMYDRVSNFTSNTTNDPSDKKEYKKRGLKSANWWLNAIQANEAWEYNDRFNNIKVGIVDSGFDTGHEDLNINFADETNEKINNKDYHGTHVAGIIGATANNKKGVAGIVWNKELICYDWSPNWLQKKLGGWNTEQAIIAGLYYIVKSGAKVVNFSVGEDTQSKLNTNSDTINQNDIDDNAYLTSKMMAHLLNLKYDFVVVHAAGNGAKDGIGVNAENGCFFAGITPENCYTNSNVSADDILNRIIVVANVEETENGYQIYKQSNGGSRVDIAAPGQNIYSTITGGFTGSYEYLSGTSMAAPMVTGVASLVWSVNENFTGPEVKEIVCNNYSEWVASNPNSPNAKSDKINIKDGKEIYGYPMVNAKLAVEEAIRRTDNDTLIGVVEEETEETTENTIKNQNEVYIKYAELCKKYINEYGYPKVVNTEYQGSYIKGLSFAKLIDFNNDNIEELLLVYGSPWFDKGGQYYVEIWGSINNELKKIYSGSPYTKGDINNSIVINKNNNYYYICSGQEGTFYNKTFYGYNEENKFEEKIKLEYTGPPDKNYIINGEEVSEKEMEKTYSIWNSNNLVYNLISFDDLNFTFSETINTLKLLNIDENEIKEKDETLSKEEALEKLISEKFKDTDLNSNRYNYPEYQYKVLYNNKEYYLFFVYQYVREDKNTYQTRMSDIYVPLNNSEIIETLPDNLHFEIEILE